jgi:hypothetical protein
MEEGFIMSVSFLVSFSLVSYTLALASSMMYVETKYQTENVLNDNSYAIELIRLGGQA